MARIDAKNFVVDFDATYIGPHWRPNVVILNKTTGEISHIHELVGLRMKTRTEAENEAERCALQALTDMRIEAGRAGRFVTF